MGQRTQLWWDLPAWDSFLLNKEIYEIPQAQFDETAKETSSFRNRRLAGRARKKTFSRPAHESGAGLFTPSSAARASSRRADDRPGRPHAAISSGNLSSNTTSATKPTSFSQAITWTTSPNCAHALILINHGQILVRWIDHGFSDAHHDQKSLTQAMQDALCQRPSHSTSEENIFSCFRFTGRKACPNGRPF